MAIRAPDGANKYKICMGIFAGNILKSKWEYESVSIKTSTNSEMAQLPSKYICLPHIGHSSMKSLHGTPRSHIT